MEKRDEALGLGVEKAAHLPLASAVTKSTSPSRKLYVEGELHPRQRLKLGVDNVS
jgi:hypothetical protein